MSNSIGVITHLYNDFSFDNDEMCEHWFKRYLIVQWINERYTGYSYVDTKLWVYSDWGNSIQEALNSTKHSGYFYLYSNKSLLCKILIQSDEPITKSSHPELFI